MSALEPTHGFFLNILNNFVSKCETCLSTPTEECKVTKNQIAQVHSRLAKRLFSPFFWDVTQKTPAGTLLFLRNWHSCREQLLYFGKNKMNSGLSFWSGFLVGFLQIKRILQTGRYSTLTKIQ